MNSYTSKRYAWSGSQRPINLPTSSLKLSVGALCQNSWIRQGCGHCLKPWQVMGGKCALAAMIIHPPQLSVSILQSPNQVDDWFYWYWLHTLYSLNRSSARSSRWNSWSLSSPVSVALLISSSPH
jgi:hypothetical protein